MEKILPSGAKLTVSVAPFQDAALLRDAILMASKGIPVGDLMNQDVSLLKDFVIEAATSPAVKIALEKCFERALYEGSKVNGLLFDDPKLGERAREDYYAICWTVIEANCKPFFVKTFSWLSELLKTTRENPKQG